MAASRHIPLILLSLFSVFPVFWMLSGSFKPLDEIFDANLIPFKPTIDNYREAWDNMAVLRLSLNTVAIAASESVLQLFTAVLSAYAFTRWEFRGRDILFTLCSLTWLIPFQAIMIPNYVTVANLGLRGTLLGIVLPFAASSFAILSIYDAFKSFPRALIEAAVMDRLSEPAILFRIVLPNIKATAVSLGILLFINGWNEYIWAMLVASTLDNAPIQIGLQYLMSLEGVGGNQWGALMAGATLTGLPIFIIYLLLRRQIINSFVRWGIK
jgi:ABC-type glycerol-3-phosphate transport system permease component